MLLAKRPINDLEPEVGHISTLSRVHDEAVWQQRHVVFSGLGHEVVPVKLDLTCRVRGVQDGVRVIRQEDGLQKNVHNGIHEVFIVQTYIISLFRVSLLSS